MITLATPRTLMYATFIRGLVASAQELIPRINNAMRYVHSTEVANIQEALEYMLPNGKEKLHRPEQLWVPELRRLWLLFVYVRFSYQRDFYANYTSDAEEI